MEVQHHDVTTILGKKIGKNNRKKIIGFPINIYIWNNKLLRTHNKMEVQHHDVTTVTMPPCHWLCCCCCFCCQQQQRLSGRRSPCLSLQTPVRYRCLTNKAKHDTCHEPTQSRPIVLFMNTMYECLTTTPGAPTPANDLLDNLTSADLWHHEKANTLSFMISQAFISLYTITKAQVKDTCV